jgi:hypothetical protein
VNHRLAPPGLVVLVALACGCATPASVARAEFAKTHSCPAEQLTIQDVASSPSLRVTGCGQEATYYCWAFKNSDGTSGVVCDERQRITFEATDGSKHTSWADHEALLGELGETAQRAAVASAAHDLACPSASIAVVGKGAHGWANVLEGCGKRITYQIGDGASRLDQRFVETGRIPIPGK